MAAYFFDSSALVKRYARETGTSWMLSLFRRGTLHSFYAARITRVEVTSAPTRKHRVNRLASLALVAADKDLLAAAAMKGLSTDDPNNH